MGSLNIDGGVDQVMAVDEVYNTFPFCISGLTSANHRVKSVCLFTLNVALTSGV